MQGFTLPLWFGLTTTAVVCGGAAWKGDREVRIASGGLVIAWMATLLLRDRSWPAVQWGGLLVDLAYFGLILAIALRSRRYWPLFLTAFQLLNVLTSGAPVFVHVSNPWLWATANVVWTHGVMAVLGVAGFHDWRRSPPGSLASPHRSRGGERESPQPKRLVGRSRLPRRCGRRGKAPTDMETLKDPQRPLGNLRVQNRWRSRPKSPGADRP